MKLSHVGLVAALTLAPVLARGDEPETVTSTDDALGKTQDLLKDPAKRDAAVKKDPAAAKADQGARDVAKSDADLQAIYELSAELMQTLTEASGGDPEKMQKMLEEAKSNPEKFAEKLTPAQRKKLADLAKQIESSGARK